MSLINSTFTILEKWSISWPNSDLENAVSAILEDVHGLLYNTVATIWDDEKWVKNRGWQNPHTEVEGLHALVQ
jgi:hypothetical protein